MVGAIKDITINQGSIRGKHCSSPAAERRDSTFYRSRGNSDAARCCVPSTAGALSACGGQFSNIVSDFSISRIAYTAEFPYAAVNETLEEISTQIEQFSARLREKGLKRFSTEYFVEARYPYQVWELDVPLAKGRFDGPGDLAAMIEAFHQEHERVFAVKEPGQQIECLYWRGRLTAFLDNPPLTSVRAGRASSLRRVYRGVHSSPTSARRGCRASSVRRYRRGCYRGAGDDRRADHDDRRLSGQHRAGHGAAQLLVRGRLRRTPVDRE